MIRYLSNLPVLKRVIPSIIKKLKISNITFNYENLIFKLDLRYLIDRRFYLTKNYDNYKIQLFNILINKFKISNFLDLGSCWGIYSLRIAKKITTTSKYARLQTKKYTNTRISIIPNPLRKDLINSKYGFENADDREFSNDGAHFKSKTG